MRYLHYDVFTDRKFEGNQLAVFHDARGLSTGQMQAITKEMNFSECTFILPAEAPGTDVRLTLPFGFTEQSLEHIEKATSFLHEVKSINVAKLPADAVVTRFTDAILQERGLKKPVGEVLAQDDGPKG